MMIDLLVLGLVWGSVAAFLNYALSIPLHFAILITIAAIFLYDILTKKEGEKEE